MKHITLSPSTILFWWLLAGVISLTYLAVSYVGYGVFGFPLDDAWIHQTYARNLAQSGQLAFTPGVPSAGSTAPLWSLLLSLGYLLHLPFKIWTYSLGIIILGLTGWTVMHLTRHIFPQERRLGLWVGLFCLLEWHHTWAALSGMETILFIWLSLFLLERYLEGVQQNTLSDRPTSFFLSIGFSGGLLVLTRPEGVGLIGLLGLDLAYRYWRDRSKIPKITVLWRAWGWLVLGTILLVIPYIALHLWLTGRALPNTFYAKQTEYGLILEQFPLWWRLFGNIGPPVETVQGVFRVIFIGPQLLLIPGLFFAAWLTWRERRTNLWLLWGWWISYLLLYAFRLPVTYQHGRYEMPVIVWVIVLGMWGTGRLVGWFKPPGHTLGRVFNRVVSLSLILLLLGFIVLGGQAYGRDVNFIETEMVATARWLADHTAPDALLAAHDIGAIGYFAQRPLIDLAGLVTPEIIPIMRNEAALQNYILTQQADYLVTFPFWYPDLVKSPAFAVRFVSQSVGTEESRMTIYEVVRP